MAHKIPLKNLWQHAPKREGLLKFLLLLSVLIGYFGYLSYEYGLATGGMVAALTWSFLFYARLSRMQVSYSIFLCG